jgi:hypothetical protein
MKNTGYRRKQGKSKKAKGKRRGAACWLLGRE